MNQSNALTTRPSSFRILSSNQPNQLSQMPILEPGGRSILTVIPNYYTSQIYRGIARLFLVSHLNLHHDLFWTETLLERCLNNYHDEDPVPMPRSNIKSSCRMHRDKGTRNTLSGCIHQITMWGTSFTSLRTMRSSTCQLGPTPRRCIYSGSISNYSYYLSSNVISRLFYSLGLGKTPRSCA